MFSSDYIYFPVFTTLSMWIILWFLFPTENIHFTSQIENFDPIKNFILNWGCLLLSPRITFPHPIPKFYHPTEHFFQIEVLHSSVCDIFLDCRLYATLSSLSIYSWYLIVSLLRPISMISFFGLHLTLLTCRRLFSRFLGNVLCVARGTSDLATLTGTLLLSQAGSISPSPKVLTLERASGSPHFVVFAPLQLLLPISRSNFQRPIDLKGRSSSSTLLRTANKLLRTSLKVTATDSRCPSQGGCWR